LNLGPMDYE